MTELSPRALRANADTHPRSSSIRRFVFVSEHSTMAARKSIHWANST